MGDEVKFERFHTVIFLNAMKRKMNIHLWPYVSIVIVNDLEGAQPACESGLMSEINQAYEFLIQSALSMAPNVNINNMKVVFGDQFFTKELLQTCGLINAQSFYDHYHLILNQEKILDRHCSTM